MRWLLLISCITVPVHLIDYRYGPRKAETVGPPVGSESFLRALESKAGRALLPRKRGLRPRSLVHCHRNSP